MVPTTSSFRNVYRNKSKIAETRTVYRVRANTRNEQFLAIRSFGRKIYELSPGAVCRQSVRAGPLKFETRIDIIRRYAPYSFTRPVVFVYEPRCFCTNDRLTTQISGLVLDMPGRRLRVIAVQLSATLSETKPGRT